MWYLGGFSNTWDAVRRPFFPFMDWVCLSWFGLAWPGQAFSYIFAILDFFPDRPSPGHVPFKPWTWVVSTTEKSILKMSCTFYGKKLNAPSPRKEKEVNLFTCLSIAPRFDGDREFWYLSGFSAVRCSFLLVWFGWVWFSLIFLYSYIVFPTFPWNRPAPRHVPSKPLSDAMVMSCVDYRWAFQWWTILWSTQHVFKAPARGFLGGNLKSSKWGEGDGQPRNPACLRKATRLSYFSLFDDYVKPGLL